MEYSLHISNQAEQETLDVIDYYDSINPLLGERFLSELYHIYDKLADNPFLYSFVSANPIYQFRDIKLRSFPYLVIYEVHESKIHITSVRHTKRKPRILR